MLLRLAYLGITNAFALQRLLPRSNRDKDAEILALRHQLVLRRQLDGERVRFDPADRAWLAALLHHRAGCQKSTHPFLMWTEAGALHTISNQPVARTLGRRVSTVIGRAGRRCPYRRSPETPPNLDQAGAVPGRPAVRTPQ
jgi:hypothetical protein